MLSQWLLCQLVAFPHFITDVLKDPIKNYDVNE